MLKTALLASAFATAALFGASATASAHSTGYWHSSHQVAPHFGVSRYGARRSGLSKYVVRKKLKRRGFSRIRIGTRNYRGYRVTACRDYRRFRMGVSKWGHIQWRARAGYCGRHRNYRSRRNHRRYGMYAH